MRVTNAIQYCHYSDLRRETDPDRRTDHAFVIERD